MTDVIDLEAAWRAGWKQAGIEYAKANPKGYDAILQKCAIHYVPDKGAYRRMMARCQYLCALEAGFPDWPTYRALHEVPA